LRPDPAHKAIFVRISTSNRFVSKLTELAILGVASAFFLVASNNVTPFFDLNPELQYRFQSRSVKDQRPFD
jgi:hypothetical protein